MSAVPATAHAPNFTGREWVLDQIATWRGQTRQRHLLITGAPGSGKSALAGWLAGAGPMPENPAAAATLADLRQQWDAVHFCVARGHGTLDPNAFTLSLAKQLSQRHEDFAEAVADRLAPEVHVDLAVEENWGTVIGAKIERLILSGERRADDLFQRAIREPLQELMEDEPDLTVLILIDALDEALTADEPNIVTLLAGSADLGDGVRFVLTSRNEPRVVDQFDAARIDLTGPGNRAANSHDLKVLVQQRLAALDTPASELVTPLVDRAEGNFLYATWVLDELAAGDRAPGDLADLPRGLFGLYRAFLDRLVKGSAAFSPAWLNQHEPFFGALCVADPAAPEDVLPLWLGWKRAMLNAHAHDMTQVIEYLPDIADGDPGFRLYHRSIAEFLGAERYPDNGGVRLNEYYVEPFRQHDRLVTYYLSRHGDPDDWDGDWSQADRYGLSHLVMHLAARVSLAEGPRRPLAADLYRVALDPGFRTAQYGRLGVHQTLADLRTTLDVALGLPASRDLLAAVRTIAARRAMQEVESLSRAVFDRIDQEDFRGALQKAEHYTEGRSARSNWDHLLPIYVAWEAAHSGRPGDALNAVRSAPGSDSYAIAPLRVALLAHASIALASTGGTAREWLADLGPAHIRQSHLHEYAEQLLRRDRDRPILDDASAQQVIAAVRPQVQQLESNTRDGSAGTVSAHGLGALMVPDPETSADLAGTMQAQLAQIADHPDGQGLIERMIRALVKNPYPTYRDIALTSAGAALLGSSNRAWIRPLLRQVLRAGLDDEGVTFTFDVPSAVLAELRHRDRPAPGIERYLERARESRDVWGTSGRALSAQAAVTFRAGGSTEAFGLLVAASSEPVPYAGYGVLLMLSLIDRCHEFGDPDRAGLAIWGRSRAQSLIEVARGLADEVYDWSFRQERQALVEFHHRMSHGPEPVPAPPGDPDEAHVSTAVVTHLSARWMAPPGVLPGISAQQGLDRTKGLIPLVMSDSTALDTVLGRVIGATARQFSDEELDQLAVVTEEHLMTGRPWTMGNWR